MFTFPIGFFGDETPGGADPFWANVVLLVPGNGTNGSTTIPDLSTSTKVITPVGNAQISTAVSDPFGSSTRGVVAFDGNGDYLSSPDSTEYALSSGDFTIECWVRLSANPTSYAGSFGSTLICQDSGVSQGWLLFLEGSAAQNLFLILTSSDNVRTTISASSGVILNQWYHIAAVRSVNTVYLFVNGVLRNTGGTSYTSSIRDSSTTLKIGASDYDVTYKYWLNGYMANVRITKGVARYTANFTPPTAPFPIGSDPYWNNVVLYLPLTGTNGQTTFTDVSQYGHTVTRNGDTVISTAQFPSLTGVSSSTYFDGNGDFLRLPITTLFNFNADFTIDCFVYPVSNSTRQDLIGNYEGSSSGWGIGINQAGSGNIIFYHGNTILVSTGSVLVLNSWNYLRVVRSASSIQIWVSNTLVGTGNNGSSFYSSRALRVGCVPNISDSEQLFINAYISHLRITNGIARPDTGIPTAPFPIG